MLNQRVSIPPHQPGPDRAGRERASRPGPDPLAADVGPLALGVAGAVAVAGVGDPGPPGARVGRPGVPAHHPRHGRRRRVRGEAAWPCLRTTSARSASTSAADVPPAPAPAPVLASVASLAARSSAARTRAVTALE